MAMTNTHVTLSIVHIMFTQYHAYYTKRITLNMLCMIHKARKAPMESGKRPMESRGSPGRYWGVLQYSSRSWESRGVLKLRGVPKGREGVT